MTCIVVQVMSVNRLQVITCDLYRYRYRLYGTGYTGYTVQVSLDIVNTHDQTAGGTGFTSPIFICRGEGL